MFICLFVYSEKSDKNVESSIGKISNGKADFEKVVNNLLSHIAFEVLELLLLAYLRTPVSLRENSVDSSGYLHRDMYSDKKEPRSA